MRKSTKSSPRLLCALSEKFGDFNPDTDVMISHGTVRYPIPGVIAYERAGVYIPIIYGEYYFVEAVLKLLGSEFNPW